MSRVHSLEGTFREARAFDGNLSEWKMSRVHNLYATFRCVGVDRWDVAKVKMLKYTFRQAYDFDADLNAWKTSSVTDMASAFSYATSFRGTGVSRCDVARVTSFHQAFEVAKKFNVAVDLNAWDTSRAAQDEGRFDRQHSTP